ncbi:MAG: NAD(P)/FAD-dependent oxidoreductase [Kofleriaceae bacterium]
MRTKQHPNAEGTAKIAVIGAGLAGLACARSLTDAGLRVVVLDKGRGPGGRTSTRREGSHRFDHGAARLELGAPELAARRAAWEADGVIAPWQPITSGTSDHAATWIGVPGSNALAWHLAHGLDLRLQAQVERIDADRANTWRVVLADGEVIGPFSFVIVTAPAPQTLVLLATTALDAYGSTLASVEFAPCLVAMVVVKAHDLDLDELHVSEGPLAQAHRMDRRPGRDSGLGEQRWVLQGRDQWSAAHIDHDLGRATDELVAAFVRTLPCEVLESRGHRWRFARATRRIAAPFLLDRGRGIGLAGDWFEAGTRAPAASRALISGCALAAAIHAG